MFTDNREPGVYISVEDRSYVGEVTESGRVVYGVFSTPKGRHRRVIDITGGTEQLYREFGQPNIMNCNLAYYDFVNAIRAGARGLAVRVTPDDATLANVIIKKNTSPLYVVGTASDFTFIEGSTTVQVFQDSWDTVIGDGTGRLTIGDWMYSNDSLDSSKDMCQIISMNDEDFTLILDKPYTGSTEGWGNKTSAANKVNLYIDTDEIAAWNTNYTQALDLEDPGNTVFEFVANGAGSAYNNLKLKAVRNLELEKLYIYEDGTPIYPYLFLNVALYEINSLGQDKMVENYGPVSLVNNLPDGRQVTDLQGNGLFIEDVINNTSDYIRCQSGEALQELISDELDSEICERNRKLVTLLMSAYTPAGTSNYVSSDNALIFRNGSDGTSEGVPLYDKVTGKLNLGNDMLGLIAQAFYGDLDAYDTSVYLMTERMYPRYNPDYVLGGSYPADVAYAAMKFADNRDDVLCLADTGHNTNFAQDIKAREDKYPWNNRNSMLYTQWRKRKDEFTGKSFWFSPVYHAIDRHLLCDARYWIHEPVANIEKGAIEEAVELAYEPNHTERGDLGDRELNYTIKEPDGTYFLTQFTTYKQLSSLKRANNAKFIHYMIKSIPPLLKDILQRRATNVWLQQLNGRVDNFLNKFRGSSVERYNILDSYQVNVEFDKQNYEANVYVEISFIGIIERINVFIINA